MGTRTTCSRIVVVKKDNVVYYVSPVIGWMLDSVGRLEHIGGKGGRSKPDSSSLRTKTVTKAYFAVVDPCT